MTPKLKLELMWWLLTSIIAIAILFPIWNKIEDYPFWLSNVVFIAAFVTLSRHIFFLEHTFLARRPYVMTGIILVSAIFIAYLINEINFFQTYLDEEGLDAIVGHLPFDERTSMASYIRNQLLLFGVGSVITAIILPLRLVLSIWRGFNRDSV